MKTSPWIVRPQKKLEASGRGTTRIWGWVGAYVGGGAAAVVGMVVVVVAAAADADAASAGAWPLLPLGGPEDDIAGDAAGGCAVQWQVGVVMDVQDAKREFL